MKCSKGATTFSRERLSLSRIIQLYSDNSYYLKGAGSVVLQSSYVFLNYYECNQKRCDGIRADDASIPAMYI